MPFICKKEYVHFRMGIDIVAYTYGQGPGFFGGFGTPLKNLIDDFTPTREP